MIVCMDDKTFLKTIKSISNPIRLDILIYLLEWEKCVCNIFEKLGLAQNLISHHLGILRKSELIKIRKDNKWVHYSLNISKFDHLKSFIENFTAPKNIDFKSNC